MSVNASFGRRSGRLAAVLATALALTSITLAGPAQSAAPSGSLVQLFTESPDFTANPANAIQEGWWGHEGGTGPGSGPTYLSLEGVDGNGQITQASQEALLAALGTDNFDDIGYAVVPYTADGANERPTVTAGENAAEAFDWVLSGAAGWGAALSGGSSANDSVTTVSTLAQLTAWVAQGRPLQGFDDNLVLHDLADPSNPVSTAPKGKSILNTWPAGTQLSLVAYVTNGFDADLQNEVPLVEVDGTGHAKTAWMPFTTVASPTSAIRTSAGYEVIGAYAPTLALTSSFSGSTASLTATIKNNLNATATDATGSLMFAQVVGGVAGTPVSVPVTNGVGTLPITGFTPGTSRTYEVHYEPDAPAQATYLSSANIRKTITNPIATTTSLIGKGGATDTFTATVTPGASGKVTFKDGATVIGVLSVSPSVRTVKVVRKLTVGRHVITAIFTPSTANYKASSVAKAYWQPTIGTTLKPLRPRRATRPKLVVRVAAPGAAVTGKVTLVFDPPRGLTRRITVNLVGGSATVLLPKVVRGLTRVTVMYLGNTQVLAANKAISFRVP